MDERHNFIVTVGGCTREQAGQVITERIGYDEDYGFEYTIGVEDEVGDDPERELNFAIAAIDTGDPANLRWLARCATAQANKLPPN